MGWLHLGQNCACVHDLCMISLNTVDMVVPGGFLGVFHVGSPSWLF